MFTLNQALGNDTALQIRHQLGEMTPSSSPTPLDHFTPLIAAQDFQDAEWFASEEEHIARINAEKKAPRANTTKVPCPRLNMLGVCTQANCTYLHDITVPCGACSQLLQPTSVLGLLTHCDHRFCLNCVRAYRYAEERRAQDCMPCPKCQTLSTAIIPSKLFVRSEVKYDMGMRYKQHLEVIHCPYFQKGKAVCPYPATCQFLHVREEPLSKRPLHQQGAATSHHPANSSKKKPAPAPPALHAPQPAPTAHHPQPPSPQPYQQPYQQSMPPFHQQSPQNIPPQIHVQPIKIEEIDPSFPSWQRPQQPNNLQQNAWSNDSLRSAQPWQQYPPLGQPQWGSQQPAQPPNHQNLMVYDEPLQYSYTNLQDIQDGDYSYGHNGYGNGHRSIGSTRGGRNGRPRKPRPVSPDQLRRDVQAIPRAARFDPVKNVSTITMLDTGEQWEFSHNREPRPAKNEDIDLGLW